MKILHVIPYFFLSWSDGKPVELVSELARTQVRAGHEVAVVTSDAFNKRKNIREVSDSTYEGARIYECRTYGKYPTTISPDMARTFAEKIREFDIVHVHELRTFASVLVHHFARKHGVPYVVQAHGALGVEIGSRHKKMLFDMIIGRRILRDASRLIAITAREATQYQLFRVSPEKIIIVPNGIDSDDFVNLPLRGRYRQSIGIPEDGKLVCFLGRLDSTKGVDILIRSFVIVSDRLKDCRLVIVGKDYGHESSLRRLVKLERLDNQVIFAGYVQKSEKNSILVDSDVFVTPSYSGFPHTFLEACACGTPIITTRKGDDLEWINENAGLVVGYDEKELAEAMIRILADQPLRQRLAENCHTLIRSRFDWKIISKTLETAYERAIDEHKAEWRTKQS
jgi:glycosyltransferase involved in cell wall biosynthesis